MKKLTRKSIRKEIVSILENKSQQDVEDRASCLSDECYQPLENSIADSEFWKYPNTEDDVDMIKVEGGWFEQSDAGAVLSKAISSFFSNTGVSMTVAVISVDLDQNPDVGGSISPGHRLYPHGMIAGGSQGISDRGRFIMFLYLLPFGDDFNESDVNPRTLSKKIANIVRHEYIHARQMEKRSKSQKISRNLAKDRFEAEGEIVDDTTANREQYLSSNIEIDAYAHEFAESLLQRYGRERSLEILRKSQKIEDLDIPDTLVDYLSGISTAGALKKLKSKMYDHIYILTQRNIYEGVRGSYPEESYERGTLKNLYLDRPTSHGGWPEGPSKSFTSNKPVNKQISGFLKDMGMLDESDIIEKVRSIVKEVD